jgi:hypothetical protein
MISASLNDHPAAGCKRQPLNPRNLIPSAQESPRARRAAMSDERQINFDFAESEPWCKDTRRCDGCNKLMDDGVSDGPVLRDDAWAKLAPANKLLCAPCVFNRARELGIRLRFADLNPCPFNLIHRPHSYFDWFLSKEPTPPDLTEWADALARVVLWRV